MAESAYIDFTAVRVRVCVRARVDVILIPLYEQQGVIHCRVLLPCRQKQPEGLWGESYLTPPTKQ